MDLFKRQLAKCGQPIIVQKRKLVENDFGESQPKIEFETIAEPDAIIKTVAATAASGRKIFSGIQIDDDATHLFCVEYSVALNAIERDNYFIYFNNRRIRVLSNTNVNEKDKIIAIQATERGLDSKDATKA